MYMCVCERERESTRCVHLHVARDDGPVDDRLLQDRSLHGATELQELRLRGL